LRRENRVGALTIRGVVGIHTSKREEERSLEELEYLRGSKIPVREKGFGGGLGDQDRSQTTPEY